MPICLALAAVFALPVAGAGAGAQAYPTRPIRVIAPFAPGGGVDFMARMVGQKLTEALRQPVIVDNRTGNGGILGTEIAARATPDGYTLILGNNSTHGVSQAVTAKLPFDTINDFAAISLIASAPHLLLTSNAVPAKTVREFIDLAKSRPGQLNYGSSGTGSQTQMSSEQLKWVTGMDIVEIPYKGVAPGFTALMSGEIQLMFASLPSSIPHVRSGRLRALAITGEKRSTLMPEMPTLHEQNVSGFETGPWYGMLAPAKTPAATITRLNAEITKIVATPEMQEKFSSQGAEPIGGTPAQLADTVKKEVAKWTALVKHLQSRAK